MSSADHYPATAAQQALLAQQLLRPGDGHANLGYAFRFPLNLDHSRLQEAISLTLSAARELSTSFERRHGQWFGCRDRCAPSFHRDVAPACVTADAEAEAVASRVALLADQPLDPSAGPLFRAELLIGRFGHYVTVVASHLVADAYSAYLLTATISSLYNGRDTVDRLSSLARGPADLRRTLPDQADPVSLDRIRADLAQTPSARTIARSRHDGTAFLSGGSRRIELPRELGEQLQASLAVQTWGRVPVFLAAHALTCSHLGDKGDVLTAVPLANRRGVVERRAVGYFVNTLPLHSPVDASPGLMDLVRTCALRLAGLQRHQGLAFLPNAGRLLPQLQRGDYLPDNCFTAYKAAVNFQLDGCPSELLPIPRSAVSHHLATMIACLPERVLIDMTGTTHTLRADPTGLYLHCLERLAEAGPSTPVKPVQRTRSWSTLRGQVRPAAALEGPLRIHEQFALTAARRADATALITSSGERISYAALDTMVQRRASIMHASPSAPVIVCRPRGVDRVVAMLACSRAGRVHVPLEPDAPAGRLGTVVGQLRSVYGTDPIGLDGDHPDAAELIAAGSLHRLTDAATGQPASEAPAAAYILFTSGTTGSPKGVPISHRQVLTFTSAFAEAHEVTDSDVWCQFHSTVFDFSVIEVYGALLNGGALFLPDEQQILDPARLFAAARAHGVTVLTQTPSAVRRWRPRQIDGEAEDYAWRLLLVGAEELHVEDLAVWVDAFGGRARVFNLYGPTEATVAATSHEVDPEVPASFSRDGESLIGEPIPGVGLMVVDRHGVPCPMRVEGELVIHGAGVGAGYLPGTRSETTRFAESPWCPGSVYFSGDTGRVHPDGRISYTGRNDRQVQIHGHRVELDGVAGALRACPGVSSAVAQVWRGPDGHEELAGFVEGDVAENRLRRMLENRIPAYMVPTHIVVWERFPLNASGKTDVGRLLAALGRSAQPTRSLDPGSRRDVAGRITQIAADVLGVDDLDPELPLMDAGGTSLNLVTLHERLVAELPWRDLDLVDLFAHGSIRRIADAYLTSQTTQAVQETR